MPSPYLPIEELDEAIKKQTKFSGLDNLISSLRKDLFIGMLMGQKCPVCSEIILVFVGSECKRAKIDPSFHYRTFPDAKNPPKDRSAQPICPLCHKETDVISPAKAEIIYDGDMSPWKLKYLVQPRHRRT